MALNDEYFAEGTDVFIGSGVSVAAHGVWSSLGCIVDATPPTKTATFRDVNPCLNNPVRKVKKKPGKIDLGSFSVTLRFDADQYDTVNDALDAGETHPIAMKLGDTGKAQVGTCYVESLGVPTLSDEGEVQIAVSFVIDDAFAQVASSTIIEGS